MRFAAIFLPHFALQAVLRFRDELRKKPVALLDEITGKRCVVECTGAAAAAGISAGMSSSQAMGRCGGITLLPRSLAQEKVAGQILLEIACALAPGVEQTAEGICTVDLQAAKIFDFEAWGEGLVRQFAEAHLEAAIGVAATPALALLAARAASPLRIVRDSTTFLAGRNLEDLSPSPELLHILRDWGIRDLGSLAKLPKSEVAARLGSEALRLWEQAAGKSERLLRYVRPPEIFEEAFEFEHEVETVEPLLFLLRRFLEQLSRRLQAVYRVAAQMHLLLPLENGHAHARTFTIPAPTADVEVLFRIIHTHLDGLHLDHRPVALRLTMNAIVPENRQLRIFENPLRDPNRFGETLGRLAALVGSENLGVPEAGTTHRPGQFRLRPPAFDGEKEPVLLEEEAPDLSIGLPLRRYRPSQPARVEVKESQPAVIFSPTLSGWVTEALGPYRLSGEWWEAGAWAVEEWDVELAGRGLYRISRSGETWCIEGCYEAEGGVIK